MTDEIKKESVPLTAEQVAKPLGESLIPGMALTLSKAQPIQFFVIGLEEKRALVERGKVLESHIWSLAEIISLLGPDVTLAEVAQAFGNGASGSNGESDG
jgi:hypothetical protein